jgi:hypothetical protein
MIEMFENTSSLPEYLYVEIQYNDVDLNKKPGFTVSRRYIHEDSYLIEMKVREKTDLDNVVRPTTAEITIYIIKFFIFSFMIDSGSYSFSSII